MLYQARICYDSTRAYERMAGIPESPQWEDLPDLWQLALLRRMKVAHTTFAHIGAGHVAVAHDAWREHMACMGWSFGPTLHIEHAQAPDLVLFADAREAMRGRIETFVETAEGLWVGRPDAVKISLN